MTHQRKTPLGDQPSDARTFSHNLTGPKEATRNFSYLHYRSVNFNNVASLEEDSTSPPQDLDPNSHPIVAAHFYRCGPLVPIGKIVDEVVAQIAMTRCCSASGQAGAA